MFVLVDLPGHVLTDSGGGFHEPTRSASKQYHGAIDFAKLEADVLCEPPKRPCTAYNYFFRDERERLLEILPVRPQGRPRGGHGKIGFADMAKVISKKWRTVSQAELLYYSTLANEDKMRYIREKEEYNRKKREMKRQAGEYEKMARIKTAKIETNQRLSDDVLAPRSLSSSPKRQLFSAHLGPFQGDDFEPHSVSTASNGTASIADLAKKLDRKMIDDIIAIFK